MKPPHGIITYDGSISQAALDRLKSCVEDIYSGDNSGKVIVLEEGVRYEPLSEEGPAKCEYCGRYGALGSCEGCGAPNAPVKAPTLTPLQHEWIWR